MMYYRGIETNWFKNHKTEKRSRTEENWAKACKRMRANARVNSFCIISATYFISLVFIDRVRY